MTETPRIGKDLAELWSFIGSDYCINSSSRKEKAQSLVLLAALNQNPDALKCLLQLGYFQNGRWWSRLLFTPLDAVCIQNPRNRSNVSEILCEQDHINRVKCLNILKEHDARQGPFYLVEVQCLFRILLNTLSILIAYGSYRLTLFFTQYSIPQLIHFFELLPFDIQCVVAWLMGSLMVSEILVLRSLSLLPLYPLGMWICTTVSFRNSYKDLKMWFLLPSFCLVVTLVFGKSIDEASQYLHNPAASIFKSIIHSLTPYSAPVQQR